MSAFVFLTDQEALFIARAIELHARTKRSEGQAVPAGALRLSTDLLAHIAIRHPGISAVELLGGAPALVTHEEAARIAGLGARTIRRMVADGRLQAVRVGRSVRVAREGVLALVGGDLSGHTRPRAAQSGQFGGESDGAA